MDLKSICLVRHKIFRQAYWHVIPGSIGECVLPIKPAAQFFSLARETDLKSINLYKALVLSKSGVEIIIPSNVV